MMSLTKPARAEPEIKQQKNGIYTQEIKNRGMGPIQLLYVVDSVAHLCFAQNVDHSPGAVLVPCAALKRRPAWADIITWVAPAPDTE
jgi:hypothetical protein